MGFDKVRDKLRESLNGLQTICSATVLIPESGRRDARVAACSEMALKGDGLHLYGEVPREFARDLESFHREALRETLRLKYISLHLSDDVDS